MILVLITLDNKGIADNWVEAEMSWVELGGGGWRWVHGLARPIFYYKQIGQFVTFAQH